MTVGMRREKREIMMGALKEPTTALANHGSGFGVRSFLARCTTEEMKCKQIAGRSLQILRLVVSKCSGLETGAQVRQGEQPMRIQRFPPEATDSPHVAGRLAIGGVRQNCRPRLRDKAQTNAMEKDKAAR